MRHLLRLLFDSLALFSVGTFLVGIAGMSMVLYFRVTHIQNTGQFEISGPPAAVNAYLKAERTTLQLTLVSMLLPLIWLSDRLRRGRASRRRLPSNHCPRCGHDMGTSTGRCPQCGRVPYKQQQWS